MDPKMYILQEKSTKVGVYDVENGLTDFYLRLNGAPISTFDTFAAATPFDIIWLNDPNEELQQSVTC